LRFRLQVLRPGSPSQETDSSLRPVRSKVSLASTPPVTNFPWNTFKGFVICACHCQVLLYRDSVHASTHRLWKRRNIHRLNNSPGNQDPEFLGKILIGRFGFWQLFSRAKESDVRRRKFSTGYHVVFVSLINFILVEKKGGSQFLRRVGKFGHVHLISMYLCITLEFYINGKSYLAP
jgi:hypothetical protein